MMRKYVLKVLFANKPFVFLVTEYYRNLETTEKHQQELEEKIKVATTFE